MPRTTITEEVPRPANLIPPTRIVGPLTIELARGGQTFAWHRGDPDITLFEGDVSTYGSIRVSATAYTQGEGGLELKLMEVADPATPVVLEESVSEQNYQQLRTVLLTPGRRVRLYVWMDECPSGQVDVSWGVWGRTG